MCSVLIFIKPDNDHPNVAEDWKKFKAGDVIDISEKDKLYWGDDIQGPRALGWWTVAVVPGVQKAQLAHLLESGPMPYASLEELNPADVKHQKRTYAVDLARIAPSMTLDDLLAAVVRKPDLVNLNVIG